MEYTPYALAIEFLVLGILLVVWVSRNFGRKGKSSVESKSIREAIASRDSSPSASSGTISPLSAESAGEKQPAAADRLRDVPIPWGWPNHRGARAKKAEKPSLAESMRTLAECLVREKQLAVPNRIDPRYSNSIRALLEDRYGPVRRDGIPGFGVPLGTEDQGAPQVVVNRFGRVVPILSFKALAEQSAAPVELVFAAPDRQIRRPWGW